MDGKHQRDVFEPILGCLFLPRTQNANKTAVNGKMELNKKMEFRNIRNYHAFGPILVQIVLKSCVIFDVGQFDGQLRNFRFLDFLALLLRFPLNFGPLILQKLELKALKHI